MAAPKGNRFWEARAKHGRRKKYLDPEDLWKQCCEYFVWVEDNPLQEEKGFAFQGKVTKETFNKMRPMTMGSMLMFINCPRSTWDNYKSEEGFLEIITRVEEIIYQQKFAGAAADLLNPNIIARDLGLKDKQEHEHSGKNGGPIDVRQITAEMDPVEASRLYREFLSPSTK